MSDLSIEQAIDELRDLVRCRCHPAFTERKLHDPDCNCDSAEAVEVLAHAERAEAERDRLRDALEYILAECTLSDNTTPSVGAIKYAARAALKGETP